MAEINPSDLSILLVEPSTMQLKVIMSHLKQEGIKHIDGVSSGAAALDFIAQYPPDLVISAMYLPDMTANQLLESIHQQHDPEINFMLISSETRLQALEPVRQAGVMAILPKPFDHEDLCRAIRATIDVIAPEELDLQSYNINDLNILVVDDSLTSRNHISRVFHSLGIENIQSAENGVDAVKMLSQSHFDLVVTDLNMPEMDGEQLVEYIRNDMGDTYLPILMLTTEQNQSRLGSVQQAGVSAILDKPFEPQSIREILYRVLED